MALNKKLISAGFAALAMLATTAAAMAAPAVATTNVNVRSGPGPHYQAIDSLQRGERVDVQECRGSWCYVVKSGPDGWVSASYLQRGRPGRPDWDGPGRPDYGWDRPGRPGWDRPGRPGWDRPGWDRPGRPDWDRPSYPNRPGSSVCFNGPNGYFCAGS